MEKKLCCFCLQMSYSTENTGTWLCPSCGKDISALPSLPENQELNSKYVQEIIHYKGEVYNHKIAFELKE